MSKSLKKYLAEFIGTAILVLFGCGTAVFSGGDLVATALAFGLAIVAAAYAIAGLVSDKELSADYILPRAFDPRVRDAVAKATAEAARRSGVARI